MSTRDRSRRSRRRGPAGSGLAAKVAGPYVRHHRNFDRWDNRPENIVRMTFLEHLHLHADHLQELWKDPEFRARQRDGVLNYYEQNPAARQARAEACRTRNSDTTFKKANGPRISEAQRRYHRMNPEAGRAVSRRMQRLWSNPEYRVRMSEALAGIEKRPLNPRRRAGLELRAHVHLAADGEVLHQVVHEDRKARLQRPGRFDHVKRHYEMRRKSISIQHHQRPRRPFH